MGFSGGGSNVLLPHSHDGTISQDGGPLDFVNRTQASLNLGDTTYSDGVHLQQLAIGNPADVMTVSGGLPAWVPAGAPPTLTWSKLGSTRLLAPATEINVNWDLADMTDFMMIFECTYDGGGVIRRYIQFFDDTDTIDAGNNYSNQYNSNWSGVGTAVNTTGIIGYDNSSEFSQTFVACASTTNAKLAIRQNIIGDNSAANAPSSRAVFGKWANITSTGIRGVRLTNAGAGGSYATGSSLLVLGADL